MFTYLKTKERRGLFKWQIEHTNLCKGHLNAVYEHLTKTGIQQPKTLEERVYPLKWQIEYI